MLSSHQLLSLLKQQHWTEVEVLQEVIEEPTEVEDSDKPEVMITDSNQIEEQIEEHIEEHKEETTTTLTEDSVEDKNPTEDPKDHTITDRDPTEARGEVPP